MEVLKNHNGNVGTMRLVNVFVLVIIMFVWAVLCLVKKELLDFPMGICSIVLILIAGKVSEKFGELSKPHNNKE
jgi:hypothetical protein